jgi:hypothetical protein
VLLIAGGKLGIHGLGLGKSLLDEMKPIRTRDGIWSALNRVPTEIRPTFPVLGRVRASS